MWVTAHTGSRLLVWPSSCPLWGGCQAQTASAAVSPAGGIASNIEGCIELTAACNRSIKTLLTCILLLMTPLSPASSRSTRRLGRWEDKTPLNTLCLLGRPLPMVHTSYFSHHSFLPAPLQYNSFHPLKLEFSSSLSCLPSSLTFLVYGTSMCCYKLW